jgi:hypothetical protein
MFKYVYANLYIIAYQGDDINNDDYINILSLYHGVDINI